MLSLRLGTGKGGLRMAPDELIGSVLQVPLGSVTPLAVAQPSAAGVALLLDASLKQQPRIFVHPLDNRATTVLSSEGLEAFLRCAPRCLRDRRCRGGGCCCRACCCGPLLLTTAATDTAHRPAHHPLLLPAGRWGGSRRGWT